ncbi:MAG: hypothetical protein JNJ54_10180 [Myxococcaceae bacterium]|nr:hypothetical protein [Myxococcaceae bacterium]
MREARWHEVWASLTLTDVLTNWEHLQRHLGRKREFWVWLLDGWRKDGLLDDAPTPLQRDLRALALASTPR